MRVSQAKLFLRYFTLSQFLKFMYNKHMSEEEFFNILNKTEIIKPNIGLENSGNLELYMKIVKEFYETGASRADEIEGYYENKDYRNYTIAVHALKSSARIVGAIKLSKLAESLEEAGNDLNVTAVNNATGELLKLYRKLISDLKTFLYTSEDKPLIDEGYLKEALSFIKEMASSFDFDSIDSVMAELDKYRMPEKFEAKYSKLKVYVAEVSDADIIKLLEEI